MILTAFLCLQLRKTTPSSWLYIGLNLVGSIMLAINATLNQAWGFVLLETVWAIVTIISIFHRGRPLSPAYDGKG